MGNSVEMYRGDSIVIVDHIINKRTGEDFNLTGYAVTFTVKRNEDDDELITKTTGAGIALTDPTNGICEITLSASDTEDLSGIYLFDVEVTKSGNVYTSNKGSLYIAKDVSRSEA